ncbi:microtubule-associated tyrosine carboxypeptidase 1-like isoform X2 [Hemitrygon akajei]|uniref:microtubule-associated tyrosine carboxypeptidase 1-like isoform X2 n=1 Tax=Hemitrygon akajei TaxID=2704970 RepID=UPI003BF9489D
MYHNEELHLPTISLFQIYNVRIRFNFPQHYFLASAMVLDTAAPPLARPQSSKSTSTGKPLKKEAERKSSERNGIRPQGNISAVQREAPLRTISQTSAKLSCELVNRSSAPGTSLVSNGQCSWMRRSESSFSVNSAGSSRSRAKIRNATSLPHIARHIPQEPPPAKSPCLLVALRPMNVDKEKETFFKSNYTYNPQFEYSEPLSSSITSKYSVASDRFIEQAVRIMQSVVKMYGSYENFEEATGGAMLSKSKIWTCIRSYMRKEGCSGEVVVRLSDDLLSQAVMMVENCRPTLTINLAGARQHWLEGMLRHEIGTHYIRGVNNSHQPWHSAAGRKQYGLKPANPTEEGLASLNSVLYRKYPFLWRAALLYYTVFQASQMSFSQLFEDIAKFVMDPNTRWEYCVRAKRGQTDTSKTGCFSKDQVYLDGVLMLLRYRKTIDFKMLAALGKVSFEDVEHLKKCAILQNTRIPHFMRDQARYLEQLHHITAVNGLTDEELLRLIPK